MKKRNYQELNTVTDRSTQFQFSVNTALREISSEVMKAHTKSDMYKSFVEKLLTVFSFAYPTKIYFSEDIQIEIIANY